ncbi:hypothetical protein MLD38_038183 [Melastoma candidum]|uniref:Uncharacterized protein n=1 Tax=Melastoma candidum TaxID=119954 RepID=A0ACB9KZA2_9MYRT|nr:hypothetical protein MLD38_038183 [Melastoma candidum]
MWVVSGAGKVLDVGIRGCSGRLRCDWVEMGRRLRCLGTPGSWDGEPSWGMGRLAGPGGGSPVSMKGLESPLACQG